MEEITITQNGYNALFISYLHGKVQQRFSFLPAVCECKTDGEYAELAFRAERAYCPYVKRFAKEYMADIIAVGYKYDFFEKRLRLPFLNEEQRRLLFTALVSADYKDDKAYAYRGLGGGNTFCLDGTYHFRLRELKTRWEGIAQYVPTNMNALSLEDFLTFLTEDGEGKVFVKDGKVYDEEYRLLSRSVLTGEPSTVAEILLGQAERIYCFGETDEQTTRFLKKYYPSKAVFC